MDKNEAAVRIAAMACVTAIGWKLIDFVRKA